jgi:hypothetical protein
MAFDVVSTNEEQAVGIVTNTSGLKIVGDFKISYLKSFIRQIEEIFGEGNEGRVQIDFKLSEDPSTPAYAILASVDGHEPHVAVCGEFMTNGTPWEQVRKDASEKK